MRARTSLKSPGFSLLEVLIGLGLLGLGIVGVLRSTHFLAKGTRHLTSISARDRVVTSLVSEIQSNPKMYQITPEAAQAVDGAGRLITELKLSVLPLAWSNSFFGDVSACPKCPGRLGYVIQPVLGVPGLFQISIRVKSSEIFAGKDGVGATRNYRFLTSLN